MDAKSKTVVMRGVLAAGMALALCVFARAHTDALPWVSEGSRVTEAGDTIVSRNLEIKTVPIGMMQSVHPVKIRQVGTSLCVKSQHTQVLPIYTEARKFYTSFRLSKGTNWLSGLPRGTYFINNRKIRIL